MLAPLLVATRSAIAARPAFACVDAVTLVVVH